MNTTSLSRLFARVRGAAPAPSPSPQPPPPPAPQPPPAPAPDASAVGLKDMILSGWFNDECDEAAPGFRIGGEDVVIDVGSGDGGLATFAARRAAQTILLDTDAERLERAVATVRDQGGRNVRGLPGDAAAIALDDGAVSRVICTEVLEHVDDPAKVMAELARIGRPGARYLLSVPSASAERLQQGLAWSIYFEKPNHIRIFEPEQFTRLVEDAGLIIESRCGYGFFWTMHLMLFWQAGQPLGTSTPLTEAWAKTWDLVLQSPEGAKIKAKLDAMAGQCNALIARKPG